MNIVSSKNDRFGLASVPALKPYLKAAEDCGIDCYSLLKLAGIDAEILQDNNKHFSNTAMERLIRLLIIESGDPCFGLHAAKYVEPSSYSVLGYIAMNCSTLRKIQAKIPIFEKIVGDMGQTSITDDNGYIYQSWRCTFSDPQAKRHEVEHVLGSWHTYGRHYLGINCSHSIWFAHPPPQDECLLNEYKEIFGCEVCFNKPLSCIVFKEEVLDEILPQANEQLLQTLLGHATQAMAIIDKYQPVSVQVKNILILILKQRTPSSETIARQLGMSNRTLQRKLKEEGLSYKEVLNELRLELALHYLEHTELTVETIADELGYMEIRSFHRGFKLWTGRTPGSYR